VVSAVPDSDAQPCAGEKEEGPNNVPLLCSYVLEFWVVLGLVFLFIIALLMPSTLWITLPDCLTVMPLATVAVLLTFSALTSSSSNLVCSSNFASEACVYFLHLIIFLLSSASSFLATSGKSVFIFTSSAENNVLVCS